MKNIKKVLDRYWNGHFKKTAQKSKQTFLNIQQNAARSWRKILQDKTRKRTVIAGGTLLAIALGWLVLGLSIGADSSTTASL